VNKSAREGRTQVLGMGRDLLRGSLKGALGTLGSDNFSPHVSLVLMATDWTGAPILLLSGLARHTQNLLENTKAGLLLDGTDGLEEPLTGGRLSLSGEIHKCKDDDAHRRFLTRHESAALYADFEDFAFYRLEISSAHYVGGFGSIHDFEPGELLIKPDRAMELSRLEPEILDHMNSDHGDVVALIATALNGEVKGAWRLTGIDPLGCDLMLGFKAVRQNFSDAVETSEDVRERFIKLAKSARKIG